MKTIERFRPATEFFTQERCYITELHNCDSDGGCSVARARVEPGVTTRPHLLDGTIERYVILEGSGVVQVGDAPPAEVRAMDVVNIPAGIRQSIANHGDTALVFLCICTPRFRQEDYVPLDDA